MTLAQVLCDELIADGYWADYIDPCSGLPVSLTPFLRLISNPTRFNDKYTILTPFKYAVCSYHEK